MSILSKYFRRIVAVGLTALLLAPAAAVAGWMGFRNETGQPVLLQESFTTGKAARPQKVYPNETLRDTPPSAGANRKFTIYDAAKPDRVLVTGTFPAPGVNENLLYVIKKDAKGTITIEPVQTPAKK